MKKMILAAFTDKDNAEHALNKLQSAGYNAKDMSIIMKDKKEAQDLAESTGTHVAEGAASGAATGGAIGALAGLLIGIGAIAIPGIGGLLIGGPLAAALGLSGAAATTASGALTGALAGGLIGALVGLGVPEEEARHYEETVKSGGVLLAVPANSDDDSQAKAILQECGAGQVRDLSVND